MDLRCRTKMSKAVTMEINEDGDEHEDSDIAFGVSGSMPATCESRSVTTRTYNTIFGCKTALIDRWEDQKTC